MILCLWHLVTHSPSRIAAGTTLCKTIKEANTQERCLAWWLPSKLNTQRTAIPCALCKSSPHYKKTIFPLSHTLNIMKNEMVYTYVTLAVFMAHKDSERFFPIIHFRQESIKFSLPQQWCVVMTLISCVWNQKLAGGTTIQNSNYSRRALWTAQLIFKMSIPGSCQTFLWWKQGLKTQFGGFRIIKKIDYYPKKGRKKKLRN